MSNPPKSLNPLPVPKRSNGNLRLSRNRVRRALARLRQSPGGEDTLRAIGVEIARLGQERRRLESELEERVYPSVRFSPEGAELDAGLLAGFPAQLQRLALTRFAAPFARPGRPPMTGRERERLLELLASGADFRFEAGRRICFERRRGMLCVRPHSRKPVYDPSRQASTETHSREVAP